MLVRASDAKFLAGRGSDISLMHTMTCYRRLCEFTRILEQCDVGAQIPSNLFTELPNIQKDLVQSRKPAITRSDWHLIAFKNFSEDYSTFICSRMTSDASELAEIDATCDASVCGAMESRSGSDVKKLRTDSARHTVQ
jgi:hypothetical protein